MCKRQLPLLAYGPTNVTGATRITRPLRARRAAHVNAPRAHRAWHLRACVRACANRAPIARFRRRMCLQNGNFASIIMKYVKRCRDDGAVDERDVRRFSCPPRAVIAIKLAVYRRPRVMHRDAMHRKYPRCHEEMILL